MKSHDSQHYYSERPVSDNFEREIECRLRGVHLRLVTDRGVFSAGGIDRGTDLLIRNVSLPDQGPFLDLGCGYGPIGLVAAKLRPDVTVYLSDPNERATGLAEKNAKTNGLRNVCIVTGSGFERLDPDMKFTCIMSNPPYRAGKRVVYDLIEESFHRLTPGGTLTCVGRTKQGAKSLRAYIASLFNNADEIAKKSGYRVIQAMK